ncbi:acid-sensing ion channel 4-B-like [Pecten maximus]|uniref:acid-sensing ion channel 4-B-like n=1 Tax=Pecten maximus TaxID=6579 RepID=UPI001458199F|nr:acid-sensing ion channel 4-B-like [Pecten maximus]
MVVRHQTGDSSASLNNSEGTDSRYDDNGKEDGGKFLDIWYNYTSSTTLHCLSRATKVDSSLIRRLLWYIFLAAMLGLLVWQSYTQISRYLKTETLLNEHSAIDEEKNFPSVTICDVNHVKTSTVNDPRIRELLSKTYMANKKDSSYFNALDVNWTKSIDVADIFYKRSVFDMFLLCLWQNKPVRCESIFISRMTKAGICATLKNIKLSENDGIGSGMGLTVILHSNISDYLVTSRAGSGFRVLLHTKNEEPDVDEHGLALSLGTASIISATKYQTSFLRHPIPAFGDDFCIDTTASDYVHQLKYITHYSYGACRLDCFTEYVVDMCGCKDVFLPGDGPICDIFQKVNCHDKAADSFPNNSSCECSYPCETVSYSTELSQGSFPSPGYLEDTFPDLNVSAEYMKENGLMLEVFLDSKMYFRREQILQFTNSDLVASIGGYMGLFIGASFGTLMELVEFFFDMILKFFKMLTTRSQSSM